MQKFSPIDHDFGTSLIGGRVYYLESVSSTNSRLLELVESAEQSGPKIEDGSILWADEQRSGRGRLNRVWISPRQKGLWMSVYLQPGLGANRSFILTFLAAVSVVEAVEADYQLRPQIKWPNDVLLKGQKICGILTETRVINELIEHAVVGIGVNLNQTREEFAEQNVDGASSMFVESGIEKSPADFLKTLAKRLDDNYLSIKSNRSSLIIDKWKAYAAFIGESIVYSYGNQDIPGIIKGIDENGGLIIETNEKLERTFYSGSFRLDKGELS